MHLLFLGCPREPKSSHGALPPKLEVVLLVEVGADSPKSSNTDFEGADVAGDLTKAAPASRGGRRRPPGGGARSPPVEETFFSFGRLYKHRHQQI